MICRARIEDQELWDRYAADHENVELRNRLVERHWPFVWRIAGLMKKRVPPSVDLGELVSAGAEGLLTAVERFDPGRGIAFHTYAATRIRGAMLDELRNVDHLSRKHRADLNAAGLIGPTLHSLDLTLTETGRDERPLTLAETLADPDQADPAEGVALDDFWDQLALGLRDASRRILELRFRRSMRLREIGEAFGCSESRMSQRQTALVEFLRARARAGSLSRADLMDLLEP